jgi:hypothetical protein
MAMSNAERQAKWRAKRNALAKKAEAMARANERLGHGATGVPQRGRRARPTDNARAFIDELSKFSNDFHLRLKDRRKLGRFSDEERDDFVQILMNVASELSRTAQDLARNFPPK